MLKLAAPLLYAPASQPSLAPATIYSWPFSNSKFHYPRLTTTQLCCNSTNSQRRALNRTGRMAGTA
eukprot:750399-Hanusia_phi.AAC.5